jgi:hypothetical protein
MLVEYVSATLLALYRPKELKDGGAVGLCSASLGYLPIYFHIVQSWNRIGAEMAHKHVV